MSVTDSKRFERMERLLRLILQKLDHTTTDSKELKDVDKIK